MEKYIITQEIIDYLKTLEKSPQKKQKPRGACENDECRSFNEFVIENYHKICLECATIQQTYFPGATSVNHHLTHAKLNTVMHDRSKYFRERMEKYHIPFNPRALNWGLNGPLKVTSSLFHHVTTGLGCQNLR